MITFRFRELRFSTLRVCIPVLLSFGGTLTSSYYDFRKHQERGVDVYYEHRPRHLAQHSL